MSHLDDHVASLARVDDATVSRHGSAEVKDRLLADIVNQPAAKKSLPGRRFWRRPAIVLTTVGALAASTAFAVVALQGTPARDLTSTECSVGHGDAVIPATTGDPLKDCQAEWLRDFGTPPPAMKAYERPGRVVLVLLADATPPSGYVLMAPGSTQNTAVIELDEALADFVGGLSSQCFTQAEAITRTQAELTQLGLGGWTVVTRDTPADGTTVCEGYVTNDPVKHTVLLGSGPLQLDPGSETARLAKALRVVEQHCAGMSATATAVRKAAAELGWTEANHGLVLTQVAKPGATCTRIYFEPGGSALVTLRGPA